MIRKLKKNFSIEFFSKEFEPFKLKFEHNGKSHEVTVIPIDANKKQDTPLSFYVIMDNALKEINCCFDSWVSKSIKDTELVTTLGYYIYKKYDLENS
jgi:hypothetical protein